MCLRACEREREGEGERERPTHLEKKIGGIMDLLKTN
jgi:hypothetical protein